MTKLHLGNIDQNEAEKLLKSQRGQSLLEFILLFAVIVSLSLVVVKGINGNLAEYWREMAQIILQDPGQVLTLR